MNKLLFFRQKFTYYLLLVMVLSGCTWNIPQPTPVPDNNTNKNVYYFFQDGVKYDINQSVSCDSYGLGIDVLGIGNATTLRVGTSLYTQDLLGGFPKNAKLRVGNSELRLGNKSYELVQSDSLNYAVIDTAVIENDYVVRIKGSFKGRFKSYGTNTVTESFYIEGKFDLDER